MMLHDVIITKWLLSVLYWRSFVVLVLPLDPTSHYCAGTDDEKLCLVAGQTVIVCDSVVLLCSLTQSNEATAAGATHL